MSNERSAALGQEAQKPVPASSEALLRAAALRAAGAIGAEAPVTCEIAEPFLDHVCGHQDVLKIPAALLPKLAHEIRQRIHECVSTNGGHLASNLGMVELTIALHRVFDFREDRLVLDVGHQAYPHKLLTGRAGLFHTLRQRGGVSGYPNPRESQYDLFHTGHAGCSVSTILGLAVADGKAGRRTHCVAVTGDGALTSGMVFEALNHAGHLNLDLLVILNDNGCSISPTTGALSASISNIRATQFYKEFRERGKELLERIPYVGKDVERFAKGVLGAASRATHAPGALFMDLGIRYFGPVDGHDMEALERWLRQMKDIPGPKLLHVVTQKGHGLPWAAKDPVTWHGARPYNVNGTEAAFKEPDYPMPASYTKVVSQAAIELAEKDPRIVAITAAMPDGTGLSRFQERFPDRYFDVGICEPHAVCFAAALAKGGLRPVVCIYSSFLQRAMDQLQHDISLQDGLPVILCLDRAGLVGDDGPTHHGVFDLAYMRALPHFVLMAPKDGQEAAAMLRWAATQDRPVAIRYPRDTVPAQTLAPQTAPIQLGQGEMLRHGRRTAVLAYGATVVEALRAADQLAAREGLHVTVANARFCKPLDDALVARLLAEHEHVVTAEDHQLQNGFGSAVLESANAQGLDTRKLTRLGIPDRYVEHGARPWQLAQCGIDAAGIARACLARRPGGA